MWLCSPEWTWTYSTSCCNSSDSSSFSPFSCHRMPSSVTDSFWVEKSTNHLRNNSFYEFVPLIESVPWSLGWASQSATAWCGLRGCHVGCLPPFQAHLQGPQRLWREAYHQRSCCLITVFLSSPLPLSVSGCICTLSPHHHLFIYPFSSAVFFSALWFFPDLWGKRTQMAPKARSQTRKTNTHKDAQTETAHCRANVRPVCVSQHIFDH